MQIKIRIAEAEDAAAACEVIRRSISLCCADDHHNDPEIISRWLANKTPENIAAWIVTKDSIALIAHRSGQTLGFALVVKDELALCYVVPQVLHQGVGKALLREAASQAIVRGVEVLRLDSTRTALPFYLRNGFSITGPSRSWAGLEAQPMNKNIVANIAL
ncbi:MAG: GNAT family N-acetyltransferase [Acidovorax sp.]